MRVLAAAVCSALWLGSPVHATAQARDCQILDSRVLNFIQRDTPFQIVFVGGPVISCSGGMRISADSAVMSESTKIMEFIGRVDYEDTVKALTTDYAQYHGNDRRLVAQGNVVLTDVETGSIIEAPFLDYYQTSDTRLEELVMMPAGRPRATLVRERRDEPGIRDTTVVDADAMEIHAQTRFVGRGNVEITREGMTAYAQSAEFAQGGGTMRLLGDARVDSDSLRMAGDSIFGETTEEEEFSDLAAWGDNATLDGDVDIDAPWIRIMFDAGEVNRLVAAVPGAAPVIVAPDTSVADSAALADTAAVADTMAVADTVAAADTAAAVAPAPVALPAAKPYDPDRPRATALSADFRLVGDSIDAYLPERKLDRVIAVGNAFGERLLEDDTLSAGLPEIARRDWLEGIVIEASFIDAPEQRADTAADRVLDAVVATGSPARSIYRRLDADNPSGGYAISYVLASRIRIQLEEGEVRDVEAEGAQGLYLQPVRAVATRVTGAPAGGGGR
jgi:lipopolysaccharide export system protein LptA